jgi:hypothetical protein
MEESKEQLRDLCMIEIRNMADKKAQTKKGNKDK